MNKTSAWIENSIEMKTNLKQLLCKYNSKQNTTLLLLLSSPVSETFMLLFMADEFIDTTWRMKPLNSVKGLKACPILCSWLEHF